VVKHWNKIPREGVEPLSLEIFKARLDTVVTKLLQVTVVRRSLDRVISRGPSHLVVSVIRGSQSLSGKSKKIIGKFPLIQTQYIPLLQSLSLDSHSTTVYWCHIDRKK